MKTSFRDVSFLSGDVLVFAGSDWTSRAIALGTCKWSQLARGQWFSHMGVVAPWQGNAMLFESTTLADLPCEIQRRAVRGVQAHNPYRRIWHYSGAVWRMRPRAKVSEAQAEALAAFCESKIGTPYDYEQAGLSAIPTWLKNLGFIDPDDASLYCDEFCSMALMDSQVVSRSYNPSKAAPGWCAWHWVDTWQYSPPLRLLK